MKSVKELARKKTNIAAGDTVYIPETKRVVVGDKVTKGGIPLNPGFGTVVVAGQGADLPFNDFRSDKDADKRFSFGDKVVSVIGYKVDAGVLTVTDFSKETFIVATDLKNQSKASKLGRGCKVCGWTDQTTSNVPAEFECPECGALASEGNVFTSAIYTLPKHNLRVADTFDVFYTTNKQVKCGYCGWVGSAIPGDGICPDCGKQNVFKDFYTWTNKPGYRGYQTLKNMIVFFEAAALPEKANISYFIIHADTTGFSLSATFTFNEGIRHRCRDCGYTTSDYYDLVVCPECNAPATWEDEGESEFRPMS